MSRNMKAANASLFRHLEIFCAHRGEPIPSAGLVRWVSGSPEDQDYLKNLVLQQTLKFGLRRSVTRLTKADSHFVVLVGFEFPIDLAQLVALPLASGVGVCVISELAPQPIVSPATIRNVVEVGSTEEPAYTGHEFTAIESLFPSVQVYAAPNALDDEATWRLFFMLCVDECRQGESWIDEQLAGELLCLADVNVHSLPYGALCQSLFDSDPRSLFMALYRCIEATYAYESCRKLVGTLGLDKDWHELAAALESEVGWHPQEAASLNLVLTYALQDDLVGVCQSLRAHMGQDVEVSAGRAIYRLRNSIVHFRPGGTGVQFDDIDWNELCLRLVGIVFNVFSHAYAPTG